MYMKSQKILDTQNNPEQKSNAGGNTIPYLKIQHRDIVIKTTRYWHKHRHE